MIRVRKYRDGDEEALRQICRETTRRINVQEYGPELVEKWVSRLDNKAKWHDRMRRTAPFVAESHGEIVGFAEVSEMGRIGAFYSHHEWQGKGIGSALMTAVESELSMSGMSRIWVESSMSASGFFKNRGFSVIGERGSMTDGIASKSILMLRMQSAIRQ